MTAAAAHAEPQSQPVLAHGDARGASAAVRAASFAMACTLLLSPVSILMPRGAVGKLPYALEGLVLAALLLRWAARGMEPRPVRALLWTGLGIAHAAFTGLWAVDPSVFASFGVRTLHAAVWAFAAFAAIRSRSDLIAMLRALHAIGCAAAVVGIAQWLLPSLQVDFVKENTEGAVGSALVWDDELGSGSIVRVTGTLAHPLGLALLLTVSLCWTPALLQAAKTLRGRWLVLSSAAIQCVGVALTYSRMAVLALGAAFVLYALRGGVRNVGATIAASLCAGLASLPFLPATLVERVFDPTHFAKSDSLIARMEMQLYGFDIGMEHGLFGTGYGCYGVLYEAMAKGRYVEQARWMLASSEHAAYGLGDIGGHNTYLEIWVEQGLPGLLLAFCAIASLALAFAKHNRTLPRGSLDRSLGLCCEAGLLAVLLSTLVIHMQEAPMPWMWLGLSCAWLRLQRDAEAVA